MEFITAAGGAPSAAGDANWAHSSTSRALFALVIGASIVFGASSTANVVVMAARGGDHTALALDVNRNRLLALPKHFLALFVACTPGELLFGLSLLLSMRSLERMMGSLRYASLLSAVGVVRFLLRPVVFLLFRPLASTHLIMPSVAPLLLGTHVFRRCVCPPTRKFTLFHIPLSSESPHDVLAALLLAVTFKHSGFDSLAAMIGGLVLASSLLRVHAREWPVEWVISRWLQKSQSLQRLAKIVCVDGAAPPPTYLTISDLRRRQRQTVHRSGEDNGTARRSVDAPAASARQSAADGRATTLRPRMPAEGEEILGEDVVLQRAQLNRLAEEIEANVAFMEAMGFDAERSRAALVRNGNDVDAAVAELVGA